MAQKITLGAVAVGTFPIYELDGYTKHSGVVSFTPSLWLNGAVSAVPVTVAEIGTSGEYKVSFTPTSVGVWEVEVLNAYNEDSWGESFNVDPSNVKFEMTASDNGVTASFGIWMTKDGVRVTDLDSMALTAHSSTGTLEHTFVTETSCSTEGVFQFECSASQFSSDVEYYLSITATKVSPSGTWSSNLGFTKV